jgi:hypothetical protein
VFGLFAALACTYAGAVVTPWFAAHEVIRWLAWGVALVGAAGVFCSVMIYATLRREFWDCQRTFVRFALTSLLLGLATLWLSMAVLALVRSSQASVQLVAAAEPVICWTLIIATSTKLAWELLLFRHLLARAMTPLKRSASLMLRDLASPAIARFALGALGGIVAPALLLRGALGELAESAQFELIIPTLLLFGASLAGELLERYLFFAGVAAPRMPGGIR